MLDHCNLPRSGKMSVTLIHLLVVMKTEPLRAAANCTLPSAARHPHNIWKWHTPTLDVGGMVMRQACTAARQTQG